MDYYFSDRGEFRWDDVTATDLAVNWDLPIKRIGFFAQAELINAFDEDAQVGGNTTVNTARSSACVQSSNGPTPGARCLAFNPFTETPVEGIHFRRGANFGLPTTPTLAAQQGSFQLPRTYRFSFGLRF